jgi:hypothetical protein
MKAGKTFTNAVTATKGSSFSLKNSMLDKPKSVRKEGQAWWGWFTPPGSKREEHRQQRHRQRAENRPGAVEDGVRTRYTAKSQAIKHEQV